MISICGNDALRELSSPGKSGSFFYLTNDDRYMIKTVKKTEVKVRRYRVLVKEFETSSFQIVPLNLTWENVLMFELTRWQVLIRMLPSYYNHVRNFEDTMVTKFFGLHCVKSTGPAQKKVMFERYSSFTEFWSPWCRGVRWENLFPVMIFFGFLMISGPVRYHGKLVLHTVHHPPAIRPEGIFPWPCYW